MPTSDEMKGHAKEAAGDLTDNDDLQREGKADQASSTAKDFVEDVKDKINDAIDSLHDKAHRD
jgi:uncharacterized protein YjbJ (UPF0337 family)